MTQNRGKQFEEIIREAFSKVHGVSIDRLLDPMAGYAGIRNICDFIVYKYPYEYYIECKTVHGNTLPFSNITDNQWKGLLAKSEIDGVFAGVICWWVDKDVTKFIPIQTLQELKSLGYKSVRYDVGIPDYLNYTDSEYCIVGIDGKKKRVFFDYDINDFIEQCTKNKLGERTYE